MAENPAGGVFILFMAPFKCLQETTIISSCSITYVHMLCAIERIERFYHIKDTFNLSTMSISFNCLIALHISAAAVSHEI